jgi:hypothetical protein
MNKLLTTTAVLGSTALVAAPLTLLATTSASAVEKSGTCGGARFELDVEKDDGRFEVEADVDNARPGSQWRVVLKHDGQTYVNQVRTADREGDVSVDRDRRNTAGKDVFRLNVRQVGTDTICSRVITLR